MDEVFNIIQPKRVHIHVKKEFLASQKSSNYVKQIICGQRHTIVKLENGKVFGFGNNANGQIDDLCTDSCVK